MRWISGGSFVAGEAGTSRQARKAFVMAKKIVHFEIIGKDGNIFGLTRAGTM